MSRTDFVFNYLFSNKQSLYTKAASSKFRFLVSRELV